MAYDVAITVTGKDKASKPIGKVRNVLTDLEESAQRVRKTLSMMVTAPIVLMAGLITKKAIDFESAFTGVRKTVEATEEQFAVLEKGFMALALQIPISTEEIFKIGEVAGQLGIKQKDILAFTKVMADLGETTNLSANEAATSLARFANITNLPADGYERLGSTVVDLGNKLATSEKEIVDMGMRLAGAGTTVGMTQEQIMSLAGALSSVGLQSEAGGTAFSRVMKEIDKEVGTGSQAMEKFAEISGMSVAKFEKLWKENAAGALISFTEGLEKIKESGGNVNTVLDDLGLDGIRVSDALLRAAGSGDLFREALVIGSKAWEENTALTEEAAKRYKTTASQLTITKNETEQLAESYGEILKPALLEVLKTLKPIFKWFKDLSPTTKTVILGIAGLAATIGPLLIALGFLASAIGAITAVSGPWLLIIGGIILAIIALGVAAHELTKPWEAVKNVFKTVMSAILDNLSGSWEQISLFWSEHGESALEGISAIMLLLAGVVGGAFAAISAAIEVTLTIIRGVINTALALINLDWAGAWNSYSQTVYSVGAVIIETVKNIIDSILTAFGTTWENFVDAGKQMIMGIVDGVKNTAWYLIDAIVDVVRSAINSAKSFLGISSPSRVFMEMGEQMMAGMAVGIKRASQMPALAFSNAMTGTSYAPQTPSYFLQQTGGGMSTSQNRYDQRTSNQDNRRQEFNFNYRGDRSSGSSSVVEEYRNRRARHGRFFTVQSAPEFRL